MNGHQNPQLAKNLGFDKYQYILVHYSTLSITFLNTYNVLCPTYVHTFAHCNFLTSTKITPAPVKCYAVLLRRNTCYEHFVERTLSKNERFIHYEPSLIFSVTYWLIHFADNVAFWTQRSIVLEVSQEHVYGWLGISCT